VIYIAHNEEETLDIARNIAESRAGRVIALNGDLGAGKTTFVRGFCDYLGIEYVSSPTFIIVNEYQSSMNKVYHVDAYRLKDASSDEIGIEDYLDDEDAIVLVEWAEFLTIDYDLIIHIVGSGDEPRKITVLSGGET